MPSLSECSAAIDAAQAAHEARRAAKPTRETKKDFYQSQSWRRLRYAALRANREKFGRLTCEVCGGTDGPWHADHRVPLSKNWSKRLDPNNVQIMCEACNLGKGNTDSLNWSGDGAA